MTVRVELVGLPPAIGHDRVERRAEGTGVAGARRRRCGIGQPQADHLRRPGADRERIVRRGLRPRLPGIHRLPLAVHDVVVDPVLDVRGRVRPVAEALGVGLVLGEEPLGRAVGVETPLAEHRM